MKSFIMKHTWCALLVVCITLLGVSSATLAQNESGYRLVPNWPKLPPGMYFGLKEPPPPPAKPAATSNPA